MDNNKQFKINNCTIIVDEHVAIFEAKDGAIKHNLQPKIVELICYLADHHPRVIPRQELIDKIWNGNEYVGEKALTNAIWHVRKLFTEYQNQEIIETIRKVGYKLSVTPVLLTPAGREDVTTEHEKLQTSFTNIYAAVTLTILVVIFGVWLFGRNEVKVETTSVKTITSGPGSELFPAPSPDGSHLVYAWTNLDGDRDLYLAHTKEPTVPVRKLTHDGLVQGISAWSPDGKYLYFAKKSRPDRTCKIIQFNVQALEEKPIVDCPFVVIISM